MKLMTTNDSLFGISETNTINVDRLDSFSEELKPNKEVEMKFRSKIGKSKEFNKLITPMPVTSNSLGKKSNFLRIEQTKDKNFRHMIVTLFKIFLMFFIATIIAYFYNIYQKDNDFVDVSVNVLSKISFLMFCLIMILSSVLLIQSYKMKKFEHTSYSFSIDFLEIDERITYVIVYFVMLIFIHRYYELNYYFLIPTGIIITSLTSNETVIPIFFTLLTALLPALYHKSQKLVDTIKITLPKALIMRESLCFILSTLAYILVFFVLFRSDKVEYVHYIYYMKLVLLPIYSIYSRNMYVFLYTSMVFVVFFLVGPISAKIISNTDKVGSIVRNRSRVARFLISLFSFVFFFTWSWGKVRTYTYFVLLSISLVFVLMNYFLDEKDSDSREFDRLFSPISGGTGFSKQSKSITNNRTDSSIGGSNDYMLSKCQSGVRISGGNAGDERYKELYSISWLHDHNNIFKLHQYTTNFKRYLAHQLIKRIVCDPTKRITSLAPPGYESMEEEVFERLKEISKTSIDQKSSKHNPNMPPDDHIIINIFTKWLSYFISSPLIPTETPHLNLYENVFHKMFITDKRYQGHEESDHVRILMNGKETGIFYKNNLYKSDSIYEAFAIFFKYYFSKHDSYIVYTEERGQAPKRVLDMNRHPLYISELVFPDEYKKRRYI